MPAGRQGFLTRPRLPYGCRNKWPGQKNEKSFGKPWGSRTAREAGFSSLTHGVITFSMASFVFTFVFPQPKDSKTFKTSLLVSVQPGYAKVKFTVAVQYSNSHLACRGRKCRNHGLPLWSRVSTISFQSLPYSNQNPLEKLI